MMYLGWPCIYIDLEPEIIPTEPAQVMLRRDVQDGIYWQMGGWPFQCV